MVLIFNLLGHIAYLDLQVSCLSQVQLNTVRDRPVNSCGLPICLSINYLSSSSSIIALNVETGYCVAQAVLDFAV